VSFSSSSERYNDVIRKNSGLLSTVFTRSLSLLGITKLTANASDSVSGSAYSSFYDADREIINKRIVERASLPVQAI
jgi:hypothetical protein